MPGNYQVRDGDKLNKLARQYDIPVKALVEANDLRGSAMLHPGQILIIPLRQGVKGHAVGALQDALNRLGHEAGEVDCDFGPRTRQAVRQFQKDRMRDVLEEDVPGELGWETWEAIEAALLEQRV